MVSLGELRRRAAAELLAHGCDSPKADTDVLLRRLLGFDKTDIILGARSVTDEQEAVFSAALARLKCGEPVQYVTGVCEVMSLDFRVNRDTLIPKRRERIAKGSGTSMAEVNALIKQFEQMQKMMKQLTNGSMAKQMKRFGKLGGKGKGRFPF